MTFERVLEQFFDANKPKNYSRYNIIKLSEKEVLLEIAVAGFSKEQLLIEKVDSQLCIVLDDKPNNNKEEVKYLYKGISAKPFSTMVFDIAGFTKVEKVTLVNGILSIRLSKESLSGKVIEIE